MDETEITQQPEESLAAAVSARWLAVRQLVDAACRAAGREPSEVTIVGVTKYVDAASTAALFDAGCEDLGESRPQSLWDKAQRLNPRAVRWHMVGHLQRNKIARTLSLITLLHSLDSQRLAQAVSDAAVEQGRRVNCLIEVNVSGDETKTGLDPSQVQPFAEILQSHNGLRGCGVMGMAGLKASEAEVRRQFATLRELRDLLRSEYGDQYHPFDQLSMGMSNDFAAAIAEGATIVRIGSSLFPDARG